MQRKKPRDVTACDVCAEAQEEPPDPTQNAMLKDIHLQQAAGITEMIQGVKDNLMQMQTLKNRDGQADAGLEIFNKIGGGGFGEVFKGKYKGVRDYLTTPVEVVAHADAVGATITFL
jgi:hypothetical protein